MKFPYQCLHVSGDILFAAKGASIHSFNLSDNTHVSSWTHPSFKAAEPTSTPALEVADTESPAPEALDAAAGATPPAKRRKLVIEASSESQSVNDGEANDCTVAGNGIDEAKNESSRRRRKQKLAPQPKTPEIPLIINLTSSSNGEHVVAVTGPDKTIWVFEHDGKGSLKQLKQRQMPKRPSSIAITADDTTIISGDKFGDVYALSLIPSDTPITITMTASSAPFSKLKAPQANELTVHSARNLKALEAQRKTLEEKLRKQSLNADQEETETVEAGDHTLLLGHVSMLTSLVLPSSSSTGKKRDYIVTADRDEHIRVSRGMPQAHIIEGFCLGHESFVNRLCLLPLPGATGETILVSGGGDSSLFVWDYQTGRLLHKVPLLEHVGEAKLAVSGLLGALNSRNFEVEGEGDDQLLVLCERVPAVFVFRLKEDLSLEFVQKVHLPGSPLDMTTFQPPRGSMSFIVSIMPSQDESESPILPFVPNEEGGWKLAHEVATEHKSSEEADLSREEVEKLLFNVESLRKQEGEDAES